jgi:hypothetical protein
VQNIVLVQDPSGEFNLNLPGNVAERQPDELPVILGYEDFPDDISVGAALSDMFGANQLKAYEVTDGSDSLAVAQEFENLNDVDGLVASPLMLLTLTGHWSMSPADLPNPPTRDGYVPSDPFDAQTTVAVVDTGYTEGGDTIQWLDDRVEGVDPNGFDAERPDLGPDVAGHGKFVASLVAQEANVAVRVARLGAFNPSLVPPNLQNVFTTDELQLYIAITRLRQLNIPYSALNLSLGAYACEGLGDPIIDNSGLAIRAAVDLWTNAFQETNAPIVAAAGNHDPNDASALPPFLPAAYDTGPNDMIISVTSVDMNGNPSAFSNPGVCGALGERLIGVGADNDWVYWSGSSFATALLSAKAVLTAGDPPCPFSVPSDVLFEQPTTSPPSTTGSSTATSTTRPPTAPTTTAG